MNWSVLCFLLALATVSASENDLKFLEKFYNLCINKTEVFKCLKIQGLKVVDRALHSKSINIIDGLNIVSGSEETDLGKPLNANKLEDLSSEEVDKMLQSTTTQFLKTHKFEISVPELVEEGRRRRRRRGGAWGVLLVALALKGTMLAMAYQGIAVMSGTALIAGKMALLLSAILGLKKLVSGGQEKTTVEIVKVPKYSESHSHSTAYEDDDHYHRSALGRRVGYANM